jgi:hypothetical protein
LAIHSAFLIRIARFGGRQPLIALAIAIAAVAFPPNSNEAVAKAPPQATTVLEVEALADPDLGATRVAIIPQDTELELTGEAAPGFLRVYYDGQPVWVPAQYLSLGIRPGIDTAVAIQDTPLLDAPTREATVLETVLAGQAVILTGASVDGYDAASHDGTGGWLNERDISK